MKMFSVALMSAAVLTGVAGAGVAYEIASTGDSATAATSTSSAATTTGTDAVKTRKRFAPCEPPAIRQGKACVTDVVRTVVLPAASARVGGVSGRSSSGDDGPLHDAFDDHGADIDDDDAFDDHGDDIDDDDAFDDHGDHSGSDDDDHSGHGGGDDSHDDD